MRKYFAILAAMMVTGAVVAVSAFGGGSDKAPFYTVTNGTSDEVTQTLAGGFVVFNTPSGNVALDVNGTVKGLQPTSSTRLGFAT